MKPKRLQKGFSVVELLIILLVVGVLAFMGYWLYSQQQEDEVSQQSPTASDVAEAPQINDSADLDEAVRVLDQNDPATSSNADGAQLDSELSNF